LSRVQIHGYFPEIFNIHRQRIYGQDAQNKLLVFAALAVAACGALVGCCGVLLCGHGFFLCSMSVFVAAGLRGILIIWSGCFFGSLWLATHCNAASQSGILLCPFLCSPDSFE